MLGVTCSLRHPVTRKNERCGLSMTNIHFLPDLTDAVKQESAVFVKKPFAGSQPCAKTMKTPYNIDGGFVMPVEKQSRLLT